MRPQLFGGGNLAFVQPNATSKNSHRFKKANTFYFVCGDFKIATSRRPLNDKLKSVYKKYYPNINITNTNVS